MSFTNKKINKMKKTTSLLAALIFAAMTNAQTVAMDFTQDDCNGNTVHLFEVLDQNNVVILEFFMDNCSPCIEAGNDLWPHFNDLQIAYPGHVEWYHFGFNNTYTCETVSNWVNENGFPSRPFANGANMVAYYGGFGMPTIVVLAGANHEIIYSEVGYSSGDDELVHTAIDEFFAASPLAIAEMENNELEFSTIFNSSQEELRLSLANGFGNVEVAILSSDGKIALQTGIYNVLSADNTLLFQTNQLANGSYIISVKNELGVVSKHLSINR